MRRVAAPHMAMMQGNGMNNCSRAANHQRFKAAVDPARNHPSGLPPAVLFEHVGIAKITHPGNARSAGCQHGGQMHRMGW